jgi:hypothetical protein
MRFISSMIKVERERYVNKLQQEVLTHPSHGLIHDTPLLHNLQLSDGGKSTPLSLVSMISTSRLISTPPTRGCRTTTLSPPAICPSYQRGGSTDPQIEEHNVDVEIHVQLKHENENSRLITSSQRLLAKTS